MPTNFHKDIVSVRRVHHCKVTKEGYLLAGSDGGSRSRGQIRGLSAQEHERGQTPIERRSESLCGAARQKHSWMTYQAGLSPPAIHGSFAVKSSVFDFHCAISKWSLSLLVSLQPLGIPRMMSLVTSPARRNVLLSRATPTFQTEGLGWGWEAHTRIRTGRHRSEKLLRHIESQT